MKECQIPSCARDSSDTFCEKHQLAHQNLKDNYPTWQKAYGKKFSFIDYLERISEDYEIGSGQWVIDVAEYLIDQED